MTKKTSTTADDDIHLSVAAGDDDHNTDGKHHHKKKKKSTKHHHNPHRHDYDDKKKKKHHREKKLHTEDEVDEEVGAVERVEVVLDTLPDDEKGNILETKGRDRGTQEKKTSLKKENRHHKKAKKKKKKKDVVDVIQDVEAAEAVFEKKRHGITREFKVALGGDANEYAGKVLEHDGEYDSDEEEVEEIEEVEAVPVVENEKDVVEVPLGGDEKKVAVAARASPASHVGQTTSQSRALTRREEEQLKSDFCTCCLATCLCGIPGCAVVWCLNSHRADYPTAQARKGCLCAFVPTFIIVVIIVIVVAVSYNNATADMPPEEECSFYNYYYYGHC